MAEGNRRHPGGRPRKAGGDIRRRRSVWLSDDEWRQHVVDSAKVAGVGPLPYMRAVLTRHRFQSIPEINRRAWTELAHMAANLNQLARHANRTGDLPIPDLLDQIQCLACAVAALRLDLIGVATPEDSDDRQD